MNTKIFSVFPACGKTYLYEHQDEYGLKILDSDSSNFSWIEYPLIHKDHHNQYEKAQTIKLRNPDFPNNYIKHIEENIGKYDYIFVSSHKEVRDALDAAGIDFTIVYPEYRCLEEWVGRCYMRQMEGKNGFPIEVLINNWVRWVTECYECRFRHDAIILRPGDHLSDAIVV